MSHGTETSGLLHWPRAVRLLAGPALIVVLPLIPLWSIAGRGFITPGDTVRYFMPTYCYLGRSLAAGHLPAWNPFAFAGAPFAANPQSGWLSFPVMLLFTGLRCDLALRWYLVLQPLLAGLGIFAFLRSEGCERPAATVGGLSIAMLISGSNLAATLPFSGVLAWTSVVLAVTSRVVRARSWKIRIAWTLATALAAGQLVAVHPTLAILLGGPAIAGYLAFALTSTVRSGSGSLRTVLGVAGLLAGSVIVVNAAILLPRLASYGQSSLSLGYAGLRSLNAALTGGRAVTDAIGQTAAAGWPLKLTGSPGAHLAAIAAAALLAGWTNRRLRALTAAATAWGVLSWILSLGSVASAMPVLPGTARLMDLYRHNPYWMTYGVYLAVAVLAGAGVQAWVEGLREHRLRPLIWSAVPPIGLFLVVAPARGGSPHVYVVAMIGLVLGAAVALAVRRRPTWTALIPVLVAVELGISATLPTTTMPFAPRLQKFGPLQASRTAAAALLDPGPIGSVILGQGGGRLMTIGRVYDAGSDDFMLRGLSSVNGYDPVQPLRTWRFVRRAGGSMPYNMVLFRRPSALVEQILGVRWLVARGAVGGVTPEATEDGATLTPAADPQPMASVIGAWRNARNSGEASDMVFDPAFDPRTEAVVEGGTSPPPTVPGEGGSARFAWRGRQAARVDLEAEAASLLIVRIAYDRHWHARMDGREIAVRPVDTVVLGIEVPPGHHSVELAYDDPSIGAGLGISGLAIAVLIGLGLMLRRHAG